MAGTLKEQEEFLSAHAAWQQAKDGYVAKVRSAMAGNIEHFSDEEERELERLHRDWIEKSRPLMTSVNPSDGARSGS